MKPYYFSRFLKRHKIRRRAVVRTIDFLVSFTLFIILLTQFYLIIINMNLNLASTSTKQENPAEVFTGKLLGVTGSQNWGTLSGSPAVFGLASDNQHTSLGYYLDLAKLGRLNSELQYLSINKTYSFINPQSVVDNISGSLSNTAFRLSTRAPIQVLVSETHTSIQSNLIISTTNWGNVSLDNVEVDTYYVFANNGTASLYSKSNTGSTGTTSISTNIGSFNYIAIVYAHSLHNWGIGWIAINNGATSLSPTSIATFLLNKPDPNSNSILQVTNSTLASGTASIRATTTYVNATELNSTVVTGTSSIIQNLTNIGTNSPVIQVYTMTDSSGRNFYRVVTEPLIFDNANYTSAQTASFGSNQFPVYQTSNFSNADLSSLYSYTTTVMTDRGPIILTLDVSSS